MHINVSIVFAILHQCAHHVTQCFTGPTRVHIQNGISISSAVFAQLTIDCPYTLQGAAPFSVKITPS